MKRALSILAISTCMPLVAHADLCRNADQLPSHKGRISCLPDLSSFESSSDVCSVVRSCEVSCYFGGESGTEAIDPQQRSSPGYSSLPVIRVPGPPGADALCLCGVLGIGFWNALRRPSWSAQSAPEWYHSAARCQIVRSFVVEFPYFPFALDALQPPLQLESQLVCLLQQMDCLQACLTCFPKNPEPRGPPCLS